MTTSNLNREMSNMPSTLLVQGTRDYREWEKKNEVHILKAFETLYLSTYSDYDPDSDSSDDYDDDGYDFDNTTSSHQKEPIFSLSKIPLPMIVDFPKERRKQRCRSNQISGMDSAMANEKFSSSLKSLSIAKSNFNSKVSQAA